ncbi:MAG TPA: L,D-transpeptidase [Acidiferrobacter sp.]|nr:L,D-transpeptidase [Acidiferrobacter sp.]
MAYVEVDVGRQTLGLYERSGGRLIREVAVATAKNGVGEEFGSYRTPRGLHVIRARIGRDAPRNAVFVGRRPTGEIYSPALRQLYPDRDWILTRILWLSGLEVGKNRLGAVDTMRRYIYIHGAPDEDAMSIPSSHGCIKMRNDDILFLFDEVGAGTQVHIIA